MGRNALDALPEIRRIAIADSLSRCDVTIAKRVNEFASDLVIKNCKRHLSPTGGIEIEEPCFDPKDKIIHMDESVDDDEYAETFKHELGHFIDDKMGCPSCSEEFTCAIQADLDRFMSASTGIGMLGDMLGELMKSPALEDRYLSDIFSAMFHEADAVRQWNAVETTYNAVGVPIYGHEADYWTGRKGPKNAVQMEIFADMFAILSENNSEIVQFVERWLPNTVSRFRTELERGV